MPEATQVDDVLGASDAGEDENIVDEAILDDMPDDGTFGEESDATPEDGVTPEAKTEDKPEGETQAVEGKPEESIEVWKARAEKHERIARDRQSESDRLKQQIAPYASRLADLMRADQEKAEKMSKDRDFMLREFANDPAGVLNVLVNQQLNAVRSQNEAVQIQAEGQAAYHELMDYAAERKLDGNNVAILLAPYGNFANLHPKQALELAKVVIDKAAAPQVNEETTKALIQATDAQNKQKLIKKTPAGHAGGSVQGREKSAEDQAWDRIKNSGPRNPLKSLH